MNVVREDLTDKLKELVTEAEQTLSGEDKQEFYARLKSILEGRKEKPEGNR